jgi:hypothetical protein
LKGTSGTPHELVTTPSMETVLFWYRPGLYLSSATLGVCSAQPDMAAATATGAIRRAMNLAMKKTLQKAKCRAEPA